MSRGVQNKRYTDEFKQKVMDDVLHNKRSYREIQQKYDLSDKRVQNWERIYLYVANFCLVRV